MNYGLVLDSSDIKKILAEYFDVEEDKIVKTKYSSLLQPRKHCAKELYMDEN